MCHICTPGHLGIFYLMVPRFSRKAFLFLLRPKSLQHKGPNHFLIEMHPQGDQEELFLPVHVGELPAELGIVGVIVAHAPRVVEVFFFFL